MVSVRPYVAGSRLDDVAIDRIALLAPDGDLDRSSAEPGGGPDVFE